LEQDLGGGSGEEAVFEVVEKGKTKVVKIVEDQGFRSRSG